MSVTNTLGLIINSSIKMCNNSQRNVFLMQFMIINDCFNSHSPDNGLKQRGGGCDGQFLLNFYINENLYHRTKYLNFR